MLAIKLIESISYNVSAQDGRNFTVGTSKKKREDAVKNATKYCLGEMHKNLQDILAVGQAVSIAHSAAIRQMYSREVKKCTDSEYHVDYNPEDIVLGQASEFAFRAIVKKNPHEKEITVLTSKSANELLNKAVKICGSNGEIGLAIVGEKGLNTSKKMKLEKFNTRDDFFPGFAPEVNFESLTTVEEKSNHLMDLAYQTMALSNRVESLKEVSKSRRISLKGLDAYVQIRNSLQIQLERLLTLRETLPQQELTSDTFVLRIVPTLEKAFTEDNEIDISRSKVQRNFKNTPIEEISSRLKAVVPNYEKTMGFAMIDYESSIEETRNQGQAQGQQEEQEPQQEFLSTELMELQAKEAADARKLPDGVLRYLPHGNVATVWQAEKLEEETQV